MSARDTVFVSGEITSDIRSARPRGRHDRRARHCGARSRSEPEGKKGPGAFEFEVLDADPRHIKRLKIRPLAASAAPLAGPLAVGAKPRDEP
jgi:hypothetical protein